MSWFELISFLLNLALGSGLIVTLVTLKAAKKEADARAEKVRAEAAANEIQNVEAAIKIWRDMAESMAQRHEALMAQVEDLRKEVNRLRLINNKIVKLLDRITPENLVETIDKIRKEIENDEAITHSANCLRCSIGVRESEVGS